MLQIFVWIIGLPVMLFASFCSMITNNPKYKIYIQHFESFAKFLYLIGVLYLFYQIYKFGFNYNIFLSLTLFILLGLIYGLIKTQTPKNNSN